MVAVHVQAFVETDLGLVVTKLVAGKPENPGKTNLCDVLTLKSCFLEAWSFTSLSNYFEGKFAQHYSVCREYLTCHKRDSQTISLQLTRKIHRFVDLWVSVVTTSNAIWFATLNFSQANI